MNPKLNSSVSVVKINEEVLEFFKTNTRKHVRMHVKSDLILDIVNSLDGTKSKEEIEQEYNVDSEKLEHLISFLESKGLLNVVEPSNDLPEYAKYRRVINFIMDYATSHSHLVDMWQKLRNSNVLIIGLGAVGTWVACNLVQSGVKNLIFIDGDKVEESNLHRQFGYTENDVGKRKADVLEKRLKAYSSNVSIKKVYEFLDENLLDRFGNEKIDLIINCADKPTVDATSYWVGEYAMKHKINHIIGGGYNLHVSLIGQTVLPMDSACVECFRENLEEENKIDPSRIKKLAVKNRKVGSFGPMCSIVASMIGIESIKILTGCCSPANLNRRGEIDIFTMNVKYKKYEQRKDCDWCGQHGKFSSL